MPKPQGQPTKRPRTIAQVLLRLMESFPRALTRKELRSDLGVSAAQQDNIVRRLTEEKIVFRSSDGLGIVDHENAKSGAIGYIFRAEGLPYSMTIHGRPPPPLPERRRRHEIQLGQYLPRLVWSPWNRHLVRSEHFFLDRVSMMYGRIFAGSRPTRAEDFILLPELRNALVGPNPVAAISDTLLHRPLVLGSLMAPALADWGRKLRVALQASPSFYLQTFDCIPFGGIRLDGQMARLREVSGDLLLEEEYWAGGEQAVHPATALIRIIAERLVYRDSGTYLRTRQVLAELAPDWKPKHPVPTEADKPQRIL